MQNNAAHHIKQGEHHVGTAGTRSPVRSGHPSAAGSPSEAWAVQGDGNAFIFQEDRAVFTFSMHGEGNFPARKQHSDIDIPLPDGTSDDVYLRCRSQQNTGSCLIAVIYILRLTGGGFQYCLC